MGIHKRRMWNCYVLPIKEIILKIAETVELIYEPSSISKRNIADIYVVRTGANGNLQKAQE